MPKKKKKRTRKGKSRSTAFERDMDKLGNSIDKNIFGAADKFGKLVK